MRKEEVFNDRSRELDLTDIFHLNSGHLNIEEGAVIRGLYLDELTEDEIAKSMGVPKKQVGVLKVRGLKHLRRLKK